MRGGRGRSINKSEVARFIKRKVLGSPFHSDFLTAQKQTLHARCVSGYEFVGENSLWYQLG